MTQRNYLTKWERNGERIRLEFLDGSILYVKKQDFDRAFGCIINLTKEQVQADFAIEAEERVITAQMLNEYMTYQATIRCTNTTTPVSNVTFTLADLQEAIRDIQTSSQSYLQFRTDMMDRTGDLRELFK